VFSQEVEEGQNHPLTKSGKEYCNDTSKYRPISLLNVGGKVLEKLLISRIMHFLNSKDLMNPNQFGFSPQKSTTYAAMAVKDFIDEALTRGQIVALVSLDVKGAFDAAWWPSILKTLKDFTVPGTYTTSLRITLVTGQSYFNKQCADR
jgi:hypothetical protein